MQSRRPFERPIGMGASSEGETSSSGDVTSAGGGATSGPGRTSIETWDNKRHGERFSCPPPPSSDLPPARNRTGVQGLS